MQMTSVHILRNFQHSFIRLLACDRGKLFIAGQDLFFSVEKLYIIIAVLSVMILNLIQYSFFFLLIIIIIIIIIITS